jgi:hypothetical protein
MGEFLEYALLAALIGVGWSLGRSAAETLVYWTNVGLTRARIWRWERRNPALAERSKRIRALQEEAMLGAAEQAAGAQGGPAGDGHGQYI